jgi:hypothetical protein
MLVKCGSTLKTDPTRKCHRKVKCTTQVCRCWQHDPSRSMSLNVAAERLDQARNLLTSFWSRTNARTGPEKLSQFLQACSSVHVLPHTSSSESLMMICTFQPEQPRLDVFLKVVPKYALEDKFREVEPAMYKKYINSLLTEHLTPHVLQMWDHFEVDDVTRLFGVRRQHDSILTAMPRPLRASLSRGYRDNLQDIMTERKASATSLAADIVFLECGHGETLYTVIKRKMLSESELWCILFQVYYTLWVLDEKGITHYDLHLDNVFCEAVGDDPVTYVYLLSDHEYVVCTSERWMPKVFDWDFAYGPGVYNEEQVESRGEDSWACSEYGICYGHNPKADIFRLLMSLYSSPNVPNSIKQFILSQLGTKHGNDLNGNMRYRMKQCRSVDAKNTEPTDCFGTLCRLKSDMTCDGELKVTDDDVLPNAQTFTRKVASSLAGRRSSSRSSIPAMKMYRLPVWDESFHVGSTNWINSVFAPSRAILRSFEKRMESVVPQWITF